MARIGYRVLLIVCGVVLGVVVAAPTGARAQGMDTAAVVNAFLAGENAHDVAGVTALFTDNATVSLATGPLQGKDQIRAWQQELADGHFTIELTSPLTISGSKATYVVRITLDTFRQLGLATLDGTEEMEVVDGKITNFVFAFTPESAARFQEALARATPPPGMPTTGMPAAGANLWTLLLGGLGLCAVGGLLRGRVAHRA